MQPQQEFSNSEGIFMPPRAVFTRLNDYVEYTNTTKTEILWTLITVMSKSSLQSCEQL